MAASAQLPLPMGMRTGNAVSQQQFQRWQPRQLLSPCKLAIPAWKSSSHTSSSSLWRSAAGNVFTRSFTPARALRASPTARAAAAGSEEGSAEEEGRGSVATLTQDLAPGADVEGGEDDAEKSEEYSATMQAAMGNNSLVYQHELGMNYARVLPDLIVGSCLQSAEDVDTLRDKETVGSILCLQQDSDLAWFDLDLGEVVQRTEARGDIKHIRAEIRDFDPFSLRLELPMAVAKLHRANRERGTVYVHCTAGLGRAPAVALAYMWWMRDFRLLEDANQVLQAVRRCGPKLFAIRAALCDILTGNPVEPVTVSWRNRGTPPTSVEVAGLDIGWHNRLQLEKDPAGPYWKTTRTLPVGKYYYKFILNGDQWTYNPDLPLTAPDGDQNVNNYSVVPGSTLAPEAQALRTRLMEDGAPLEGEERALVMKKLDEMADSL